MDTSDARLELKFLNFLQYSICTAPSVLKNLPVTYRLNKSSLGPSGMNSQPFFFSHCDLLQSDLHALNEA